MKDRQRNAIVVIIIVATLLSASFLFIHYSNPVDDYEGIPDIDPYINDRVGVLLESDAYDLDSFCADVEYNNSCEISLLIVNNTGIYDLYTFTVKTFEKNGIGQEGKDNGVLVVFLIQNGVVSWQTVPGKGVNSILSGFVLKGFENDYLIPQMELGDLSYGITLYIYAIGLELVDNYVSEGNDPWNDYPVSFIPLNGWQLVGAIIILIFLTIITRGRILFFLPYLFSRGGGRGGFGGGKTGGGGSRGRF